MGLGSEDVRAAVARLQRKEAKAKKKAEAEARRAEAEGAAKAGVDTQGAEAEEVPRAAADEQMAEADKTKKKRKAVMKARRAAEADPTRKRPWSQSPPTCAAQNSEAEREAAAPIDLTADTPPEGSRVGVQPSPPPAIPEVGPSHPALGQSPSGALPADELGAEETPQGAEQPEAAPAEAEEDFSLRSMAERGKWAEEMAS